MRKLPLYRYTNAKGHVIDSLELPNCDYIERIRLIADEGKLLSHEEYEVCPCIDTDNDKGWTEIDPPEWYPTEDSEETEDE